MNYSSVCAGFYSESSGSCKASCCHSLLIHCHYYHPLFSQGCDTVIIMIFSSQKTDHNYSLGM